MYLKYLIAGAVAQGSTAALAQDELYAAPPPPDAAFVRFIDAEHPMTYAGIYFPESANTSDYFVVHSAQIKQEPSTFVTVLADGTALVEPTRSIDKVLVEVVNLAGVSLDLKTVDGTIAIVSSVAPGGLGTREVNPITVTVQFFDGREPYGDPVDLSLRRNVSPTLVIEQDGKIDFFESKVRNGLVE